jgi:hypothetical protein
MKLRILACFAAPALLLCAEGGSLNGPVPALVYDETTRALRPMIGVPGAAYLGAAIVSDIDGARVSPDSRLVVIRRGSEVSLAPVATTAASALAVANGREVRLWNAEGTPVALAAAPGAVLTVAAANDHAVIGVEGGVYVLDATEARRIALADQPVAIAIAGPDVYFADSTRGEAWVLRNYRDGGEPALAARIDGARGVAVSPHHLLIAGARSVMAVQLTSLETAWTLDLEFEASGLETLGTAGWLLNAGQPGPLQVLSIEAGTPAVFFVPRGTQEGN